MDYKRVAGHTSSEIGDRFPRAGGTYALLLWLDRGRSVRVGRLGERHFARGHYLYLGSAHGPGGLKARVGRHLRGGARAHWHVDALRNIARPVGVWWTTDARADECDWAARVGQLARAGAVRGFGATDCACEAHVFYLDGTRDRIERNVGRALSVEKLAMDNSARI